MHLIQLWNADFFPWTSRLQSNYNFELPVGNFACLLAWDARDVSSDKVSEFIEPLLHAGACYFVCWGQDCERVHDIIDEMVSYPENSFSVPNDSCIMTTWHADETLEDALIFFS
jgi:hypothetical protein